MALHNLKIATASESNQLNQQQSTALLHITSISICCYSNITVYRSYELANHANYPVSIIQGKIRINIQNKVELNGVKISTFQER
jgi:hypothetical protein